MNSKPFFSIVIPTYNRAALISKTISSLLQQSYSSFEIIIIDDGSKDNTAAVVQSVPDDRIVYRKVVNGERGRARNIGTLQAKGDYITFIDSDDLAYPNHLAEAVRMVEQYNGPEMFHLAYEMKDAVGQLLFRYNNRKRDLRHALLKGNLLSCIGVFLRQDIARQYLFEEDRNLAGTEDWHLWLRLAARFPLYYSNTVTACMINHESRSVLHFNKSQMLDRTNLLTQYLDRDDEFKNAFGKEALKKIEAHMYTYMALHSVLARNNTDGLQFLLKGVSKNALELFQRRTLAIFKCMFKNLLPASGIIKNNEKL